VPKQDTPFVGPDFGNLIQTFLPVVGDAMKNYQKNGHLPNFFSPPQQQNVKRDYKKEMEQLRGMGFKNDKLNKTYLEKFNGNVKKVVAEYFK